MFGVLAQLVERLNGIEEVRGSNPLGSSLRSAKEDRLPRGAARRVIECLNLQLRTSPSIDPSQNGDWDAQQIKERNQSISKS